MTGNESRERRDLLTRKDFEGMFGRCPDEDCDWIVMGGSADDRLLAVKSHIDGHLREREATRRPRCDCGRFAAWGDGHGVGRWYCHRCERPVGTPPSPRATGDARAAARSMGDCLTVVDHDA